MIVDQIPQSHIQQVCQPYTLRSPASKKYCCENSARRHAAALAQRLPLRRVGRQRPSRARNPVIPRQSGRQLERSRSCPVRLPDRQQQVRDGNEPPNAIRERGFEAALTDMNDYMPQLLKNERRLLIVVSTHGEGEPPVAAETLHQFLHSARAPKVPELRCCAGARRPLLPLFCKAGRDFDENLAQLGAQRLTKRVDCDTDFEEDAEEWIDAVLEALTPGPLSMASPAPSPKERGRAPA